MTRAASPAQVCALNTLCLFDLHRQRADSNIWMADRSMDVVCRTPTMVALWRRGWIVCLDAAMQAAGPGGGGRWHITGAGLDVLEMAR